MTIRQFKKEDEGSFLRCVKDGWNERAVYDAVDYCLIDPYWYVDNVLYNPDYIVLVALDIAGDVVGYMVGRKITDKTGDSMKIVMLFVNPDHRRQGIGKSLKVMLAKFASDMGCEKIVAYNRYDNDVSFNLNKSLGWSIKPVGDDHYRAELLLTSGTLNNHNETNQ